MESRPLVTIAIATKDDEPRLESVLRSALVQDYPAERTEILVADAMSMDATREIVLRYAREHGDRVRLLENPERTRASALNVVLGEARGEIIVPFDPGGEYGRTHVSKCVDVLAVSPAEHLAVVPRTAGKTLVERALAAAQTRRLAFAAGAELARGTEEVPTVLAAIRRRVFDRVGLFDPQTRVEEDVELSDRIRQSGGLLAVARDIVVHRAEAASFRELFQRHYALGRSRARRTVKERRVTSVRTLAPLALVTVGGALAVTSTVQPITPLAAAGYALMTGAAAVRVGQSEGLATVPIAWAAFPVMHLAHGVGFGTGLVRALLKPDWLAAEPAPSSGERPLSVPPGEPRPA